MATCEAAEAAKIQSGQATVCEGAQGTRFTFAVEHANPAPLSTAPELQRQRRLQEAATPAPVGSAPETPETPAPSEPAAPEPETDAPVAETDPPTPEPEVPTLEPTATETPEPTSEPTPEPTSEPTPEPTSEPTPEPTPEPVFPDFPAPTPSPVAEPTPRPVAVTPEPTAAATTEPPVTPTTPAPEAIVAATPAPAAAPVTAEPTPGDPATPAPAGVAPTAAPPVVDRATPTAAPSAGAGTSEPPAAAPTSASSSLAPDQATPAPTTPQPTFTSDATLSPNADEVCTDACLDSGTASDYTANYLDYRCQGKDDSELAGCNLALEVDSTLENCRGCIIDLEAFEADFGVGASDWPLCPCCVATQMGFDPVTDECIAEAGTEVTTPSPTTLETSIDLRTSANDPDLLMLRINSEDCTATGVAIISDSRVMEVTRYSDEDDECTAEFVFLYGTECEAADTTYSWDYGTESFSLVYNCNDGTTSSASVRRRLAALDGSLLFPFQSESSDTVLCNNGEKFVSLSNLEGDEEGLVYATPDAEEYDNITSSQTATSGTDYCGADLTTITTAVLTEGVDNVLTEPDELSSSGDGVAYEIIIPVVGALLLLLGCGCLCCYRNRKGKDGRATQMRRNLGYTPDMEAKGEGNFGPTNKHVAITRGGGAQVTPEMPNTAAFRQPTYPPTHHRAPSEAPSSIIEDNIANNYRPKTAAKSWKKRKEHKELTKPAAQQHVIGAAPTSEELKAENARSQPPSAHSASGKSEHLSERSLSQLELANQTAAAQPDFGYTFEEAEDDDGLDDDDDDARSAASGMSGPSKYAPSGYAPSSHHGGVTHDLMSQYEPSVYEADSQYDPSLYGRESEYGDESSSYSYADGAGSSRRGGGGGRSGRGGMSGRASVADTAAMSHLGSVMENDDGGSAYAPSDSYVSSYVSSEDDDGRPARSIHPRAAHDASPSNGSGGGGGGSYGPGSSRHSAHRSGRELLSSGGGGRGGGGRGGYSGGSASSRHSGARSGGFEGQSAEYDEDDIQEDESDLPVSMEDLEYYEDAPSGRDGGRGGASADLEAAHGGRTW